MSYNDCSDDFLREQGARWVEFLETEVNKHLPKSLIDSDLNGAIGAAAMHRDLEHWAALHLEDTAAILYWALQVTNFRTRLKNRGVGL